MATHKIKLNLDPSTGDLSVPEVVKVDWDDYVLWVRNHPRIEWFSIAGKVGGRVHPFHHLNSNPRFRLKVRVLRSIPPDYWWEYLIKYKLDTEDKPRILDPKIAVKPTRHLSLSVIISLALGIATLTAVRYFYRKRINR